MSGSTDVYIARYEDRRDDAATNDGAERPPLSKKEGTRTSAAAESYRIFNGGSIPLLQGSFMDEKAGGKLRIE